MMVKIGQSVEVYDEKFKYRGIFLSRFSEFPVNLTMISWQVQLTPPLHFAQMHSNDDVSRDPHEATET